jgi:hypothetical protein
MEKEEASLSEKVVPASLAEYQALLEDAKVKQAAGAFAEFEQLHVIDVTGRDPAGRTIIVVVASRVPVKKLNMVRSVLLVVPMLTRM